MCGYSSRLGVDGRVKVQQNTILREMTHKSEAIQDCFYNPGREGRAAKLAHVARNRNETLYRRVVVDDHVYSHGGSDWIFCVECASFNTHSSAFSTLFSMASAGLPNTARHTCVWIDMSAGRNRISRLGAFEPDSARQTMSSSTRTPIRYPRVFSLGRGTSVSDRKANGSDEHTSVRDH